jgi:hypothetical protein
MMTPLFINSCCRSRLISANSSAEVRALHCEPRINSVHVRRHDNYVAQRIIDIANTAKKRDLDERTFASSASPQCMQHPGHGIGPFIMKFTRKSCLISRCFN